MDWRQLLHFTLRRQKRLLLMCRTYKRIDWPVSQIRMEFGVSIIETPNSMRICDTACNVSFVFILKFTVTHEISAFLFNKNVFIDFLSSSLLSINPLEGHERGYVVRERREYQWAWQFVSWLSLHTKRGLNSSISCAVQELKLSQDIQLIAPECIVQSSELAQF